MSVSLRIGSRGSALALAQANQVAGDITRARPDVSTDIDIIRTSGDRLKAADLAQLAGETKGLFVKEIEEALLKDRIDVAVHSLKDLPAEMAPGLCLGAVPRREDPRDALLCAEAGIKTLEQLPSGSTLATGSPRRRAQLLEVRPDLDIVGVRGNVDTRLRRLREGRFQALVLATAGLNRLGLSAHISSHLPVDVMTPAVGQGALGIQVRTDDSATAAVVSCLDDATTRVCVEAERWFLAQVGGGCQLPLGALAECGEDSDSFRAFWERPAGPDTRCQVSGPRGSVMDLARQAFGALSAPASGEV